MHLIKSGMLLISLTFLNCKQKILTTNVKELCPESLKARISDVCRNRWVERVDGLDVFQELFVALVTIFKDMSLNHDHTCNNCTSIKASNFLELTTSFDTIVSLVIARSVLDQTLPVTQVTPIKNYRCFGWFTFNLISQIIA